MTIITAAGLTDLYYQRTFNKNGSTVTLKKISETEWILFGDLAEGDSEGFVVEAEQYVPLIVEASGAFTVQANREVELLFSWDNLNWSQVTVLGYTEVSPPPHGETLCYIREADTSNTEGITFPSQQSTNGRNFHGVVQWWDSPTPIKLNLGWKDFYVPQESPENMTDMSDMFRASYVFNQDISGWDVSKAENMDRMFMTALEFNQDLSGWCVSQFPQEPFDFSRETDSWSLPKPVWGTCPQEDSGGESEPDLGPGPWDIDPEHPEYFIPGRYVVSGSGGNFHGYMYIGTGSSPEAACNGLRSAMWGQRKEGVHSNQDAHNNRLSEDGEWCSIETIWNDRITNAYIHDGIDAFIASGRDPMLAVRYDNGDEE